MKARIPPAGAIGSGTIVTPFQMWKLRNFIWKEESLWNDWHRTEYPKTNVKEVEFLIAERGERGHGVKDTTVIGREGLYPRF